MQYFDLSCVAFEDLPYVTLLCRLLKQLPTSEHSAEELDNLLAGKLGFLSFTTEVMTQPDVDGVRPYLLVSAGALSEKIDADVYKRQASKRSRGTPCSHRSRQASWNTRRSSRATPGCAFCSMMSS